MTTLSATKTASDKADNEVSRFLLAMPREARNKVWTNLYYSAGHLNAKKWAAFLKFGGFGPEVIEPLSALVATAQAARAAYVAAREADKVRRATVREERAARAAYKAANGPRPANPTAGANWDILTKEPKIQAIRAEFVAAYVATERAAFDALRATNIAKGGQAAEYAEKMTFPETQARRSGEFEFDSYLARLASKIEGLISTVAGVEGPIWTDCRMTVETATGRQVWRTHCIRNNRYGHNARNGYLTQYFQWPTRRAE